LISREIYLLRVIVRLSKSTGTEETSHIALDPDLKLGSIYINIFSKELGSHFGIFLFEIGKIGGHLT